MKLQLQNILKVESADIELGGLTVITGENDSGKSSIGKVLFSLLKATNNVKQVDKFKTLQFVTLICFLSRDCSVTITMFKFYKISSRQVLIWSRKILQ